MVDIFAGTSAFCFNKSRWLVEGDPKAALV